MRYRSIKSPPVSGKISLEDVEKAVKGLPQTDIQFLSSIGWYKGQPRIKASPKGKAYKPKAYKKK